MAFGVTGIDIHVFAKDDSNTRGRSSVAVDPTVLANQDTTNLLAYADALAAAAADASDAKFERHTISIRGNDPAAVEDATFASSNVERKAAMVFDAGNSTLRLLIPSPDPTLINTDDVIDVTAGAPQTLADLVVTGDGTIQPVHKASGGDITAVREAFQYHKRSQRSKSRRQG